MEKERDYADIALLTVTTVGTLLLLASIAPATADNVQALIEPAIEAAPYEGPIEALLAAITVIGAGVAYGKRKLM